MFSTKHSSDDEGTASFVVKNGLYRLTYSVGGINKRVGFGQTSVVIDATPSFSEFYLWPWAHRLLYLRGFKVSRMFPWPICYTRVSGWSTVARPMIFSPTDLGMSTEKIQWINDRVKDLEIAGGKA